MAELPNSIVVVCDFHARKVLQNDPPLSGVIKVNKLGSLAKNVKREPPSGAIYGIVSHYGSCHFWYDNWLATGALFLRAPVVPNLSFRNFIINGHWDVNLLSQTLPRDIVSSILKFPIPEGERADEVIWMHTSSGNFTLTSAFWEVRQVCNTSMVFFKVWHPTIPWQVSFFMLRLLMGKLPLPDTLCKLGFHLPSKCFCCQKVSEESIEHVFSSGHIALEVWNYFGGLCGLNFLGVSSRIVEWWLRSQDSAIRHFICLILPSITCWHI